MSLFDKLKDKFGSSAGAQSGQDCMYNAVHNASLAVASGEEPSIYDVHTTQGRHAYIGVGNEVHSLGLTWLTDFYPELSREQIDALGGADITRQLFEQALNPKIDKYGYHRVLDRLEVQIPDIKSRVRAYLKRKR